MVGVGDRNQRRQVEDNIAPRHSLLHAVGIADVTRKDIQARLDLRCGMIQPTPRVEGVVKDKGAHGTAPLEQRFRQMRTDKAIGPCYKNS